MAPTPVIYIWDEGKGEGGRGAGPLFLAAFVPVRARNDATSGLSLARNLPPVWHTAGRNAVA